MMDISFKTDGGTFNYRVAAVITDGRRLLVAGDKTQYYYLPGGRVKFNETAEEALKRELAEETGLTCKIIRPLWLIQNFFHEDAKNSDFHELGIYYLCEIENLSDDNFESADGGEIGRVNNFYWLTYGELKSADVYPRFIRENIDNLPEHLTFITEGK